jgi:hypothetical protein
MTAWCHVTDNGIGVEGGKEIDRVLVTNTTLTRLRLRGESILVVGCSGCLINVVVYVGNEVRDLGGQEIGKALAINSNLTMLHITGGSAS